MKLVLAAAAAALIATPALAQHGGHDRAAPAAAAAPAAITATGVIKSVDAKAGTVKIHHGPIPALKWPAMTMDFKASPQALAAAKPGKSVTFTLDASGKQVTAIR